MPLKMRRSSPLQCVLIWMAMTPWAIAADNAAPSVDSVIPLHDLVLDADEATARECLGIVTRAAQNGELSAERLAGLQEQLGPRLSAIVGANGHPLRLEAALLATVWQDSDAIQIARVT